MVSSAATTVDQYLRALPADRRREIQAVREVVRGNLPSGYIESIEHGMIAYAVPLARFPDTYNGKALCFAALAAQKHHNALYLMGCYMDPTLDLALRNGAEREGKRLDMGKSCVRFQRADDLPLRTIGAMIAKTPVRKLVALHDAVHGSRTRGAVLAAPEPRANGASAAKRPVNRSAIRKAPEMAGDGPRRARAAAAARSRGRRPR